MSAAAKPILAVTLGDPAGTGPELITKAFAQPEVLAVCRPVVIGDAAVVRGAAALTGATLPSHHRLARRSRGRHDARRGRSAQRRPGGFMRGKVSAHAGQAAYEAIERAVGFTLAGEAHAVVTSALNKAALHAAGHHYDGHTELLSELCGKPKVTMMLVAEKLRVCHVSTHVSLREAIERVKPERIVSVIQIARAGVQELGIADPHIAVAGVNPHAGEGGIFGDARRSNSSRRRSSRRRRLVSA